MGYRDELTGARQRVEALEGEVAELAEREGEASGKLQHLQAQLAQAYLLAVPRPDAGSQPD